MEWFEGVIVRVQLAEAPHPGVVTCFFEEDEFTDEWEIAPGEVFDDLCFPSRSGEGGGLRISEERLADMLSQYNLQQESDDDDRVQLVEYSW